MSGGRLSWVVDPPAAPRPDPSRPAAGPDPLAVPLARAAAALALLDGLAVPAGAGRRGNRLGHALGQARAALRRAAALAGPGAEGGGKGGGP